jgi:HSP20 family protein
LSIEPDNWFNRFLGTGRRRERGNYFDDMFRGFDQMRREMEREFEEPLKILKQKHQKI